MPHDIRHPDWHYSDKRTAPGATEKTLVESALVLLLELLGLAKLPFSTHFDAKHVLHGALCVLIATCGVSGIETQGVAALARHAEGILGEGGSRRPGGSRACPHRPPAGTCWPTPAGCFQRASG